jgi:putative ABC transport system permease protein
MSGSEAGGEGGRGVRGGEAGGEGAGGVSGSDVGGEGVRGVRDATSSGRASGRAPVVYRWLLRLLPRDMRAAYGGEIERLFASRLAAARGRDRPAVWLHGIADVVRAAAGERWDARRRRSSARAGGHGGRGRLRRVVDDLRWDLRFALRGFRRARGFTIAAVLTLGVGLGVATGLFTVIDAVVLRPLPYADAERLAVITSPFLNLENAASWQSAQQVAEATATYSITSGTARTPNGAVAVRALPAGRGLLELLGIRVQAGRGFVAADHAAGAPPVALVTRSFARQWFGAGSPVGRSFELDGRVYEVIGTVDRDEFLRYRNLDVWVPHESLGVRGASLLARLPRGTTPAAATEALRPLAAGMATPADRQRLAHLEVADVRVIAARDAVLLGLDGTLWMVFGAGIVVLLLAAVNVASLLVGRGIDRAGEMAVRAALGAGRARLVRQLIAEGVVLALLGAVVGLVIAAAAPSLLSAGPDVVPRAREVGLDLRAVLFGVVAAGATVLLFGVPPGLAAARSAVAVRAGRGRSAGRRAARAQSLLAVVQVAAAVVLVVGSALMVRSWAAVRPVDPGFVVDGRTVLALSLPPDRYADDAVVRAFAGRLLERLRAVPGASASALTTDLPLTGMSMVLPVATLDGAAPERPPNVHLRAVSAGYFDLMRMPIVVGRGLTPADGAGAPPVAVVNERAAARLWGDDVPPLGRTIALDRGAERPVSATVVGVVRDTWIFSGPRPAPEIFVSFDQYPHARLHAVLASATGSDLDAAHIRAALAELDPRLPARELTSLADMIGWSSALPRFQALLLGMLGAIALFLAAVGCFAVLSRSVAARTHELGIRMALGARGGDVVALVLRRAGTFAVIGIVAGGGVALAATRLLAAHLHGVTPTDPVSFAVTALVLGCAVLSAALRPALRAARTDPASTLRA